MARPSLFLGFITDAGNYRMLAAYDSIPCDELWHHLHQCQLPIHLLSILKNLNHNDNYILVDGDKQAYVKPTYGVKQGCPLSPLLFSIYLNDINEVSEGIEGACTGTPNFHVSNLLYADDLCLTSNSPNNLQAMLNRLKAYACRKFLTVNTKRYVIVCFNSKTDNLPPLFYGGEVLPYKGLQGVTREKGLSQDV
eukprot:1142427-Pelagomonas_calceolata.AAC.1